MEKLVYLCWGAPSAGRDELRVQLGAKYVNLLRGLDPDPCSVAADGEQRDHRVADQQLFTFTS